MKFPLALSRLKRRFLASKTLPRFAALALPFFGASSAAWAQTALHQTAHSSYVTPVQSIILGLVQGLTEFIPVSSSAHLNIVHALMGHPRELSYDVMLSIGTVLALAWYYRHDWRALLFDKTQAKLRNLVFLSCVPAALLAKPIHKFEDQPPLSLATFNAAMLLIAGAVLLYADKTSRQNRELHGVTARDSLIVGVAQALALVPGVSRSGATITAGRFLGFNREDAARFSFLMSLPISIGAIAFKFKDFKHINAPFSSLVLGTAVSAVSGFWAIGFLLNYLKKRDVTPFFIWRAVVALIVFVLASQGKL